MRLGRSAHRLADHARSRIRFRRAFGAWRGVTARTEDWLRGIKTEALIVPNGSTPRGDAHLYVPVTYGQARKVLRALDVTANDVVMDVGCGLGRVVALAVRSPAMRVIGIEFDPAIADAARQNMSRMTGGNSSTAIITADAADSDFSEVTVILMFNPFGPSTMHAMLQHLGASIKNDPRHVRIAYINPTAESVLSDCEWLTKTTVSRSARFRYSVSFWESTDS